MSQPLTAGAKCAADLSALLRARNPLLWVVSREEARAERLILDAASAAGYTLQAWDCAAGITDAVGRPVDSRATDPTMALADLRDAATRRVLVLRDLPAWMKDPTVTRAVRNLCRTLPSAPRDQARAMIVLSPSGEVPPELAGHAIVVDVPLPDREEVAALLDAAVGALPDDIRANAAPNGTRERAIDAAIGLSAEEVQATYARSLIASRKIDPALVSAEKRRVVSRERVLEWFEPLASGLDGIGGLDVLKGWLKLRRSAFTAKAREYGLPAPKGVMLVGVPGTGKSLAAKAVAAAWGMPLLRLDLGALQSKWVGESQQNIRKALALADTVSPCIVWLDEVEKALAGATQGAADGGVSSDALGALLSWMQDRPASSQVFVVATANDVSKLPAEFLRKGRFDECFFVDIPNAAERAEILAAALKAHGRALPLEQRQQVAAAAVDFVGAEIAALVPEALFAAFNDGERELTVDDLLAAAATTVPLAKTAGERIGALRQWAVGRARMASTPEAAQATDRRALDL